VIAVDLADCVRGTVGENVVEKVNFIFPVAMRAELALGEHERLARVKAAVDGVERSLLACDLEDAGKS
jgi:hypothetical protein